MRVETSEQANKKEERKQCNQKKKGKEKRNVQGALKSSVKRRVLALRGGLTQKSTKRNKQYQTEDEQETKKKKLFIHVLDENRWYLINVYSGIRRRVAPSAMH